MFSSLATLLLPLSTTSDYVSKFADQYLSSRGSRRDLSDRLDESGLNDSGLEITSLERSCLEGSCLEGACLEGSCLEGSPLAESSFEYPPPLEEYPFSREEGALLEEVPPLLP